jgi:hypothetical protein
MALGLSCSTSKKPAQSGVSLDFAVNANLQWQIFAARKRNVMR